MSGLLIAGQPQNRSAIFRVVVLDSKVRGSNGSALRTSWPWGASALPICEGD
jgi:hypothetical protein